MRYTPLATDALYPMPYALCPMPARAPHVTEKGYNTQLISSLAHSFLYLPGSIKGKLRSCLEHYSVNIERGSQLNKEEFIEASQSPLYKSIRIKPYVALGELSCFKSWNRGTDFLAVSPIFCEQLMDKRPAKSIAIKQLVLDFFKVINKISAFWLSNNILSFSDKTKAQVRTFIVRVLSAQFFDDFYERRDINRTEYGCISPSGVPP